MSQLFDMFELAKFELEKFETSTYWHVPRKRLPDSNTNNLFLQSFSFSSKMFPVEF